MKKLLIALLAITTITPAINTNQPANALSLTFEKPSQQLINSGNVGTVYYNGGRFVKQAGNNWVEMGDNGARFNFVETGFDETTVYLFDNSRNVQIGLDVSSGEILYAQGVNSFQLLYIVTGMELKNNGIVSSNPPRSEIVNYTCNEGIPLVVRYEFGGNRDLAFVSHDSFPEIRMEQIPSGSGSLYVSGNRELHTKGRTAIFMFGGSQDVCHER